MITARKYNECCNYKRVKYRQINPRMLISKNTNELLLAGIPDDIYIKFVRDTTGIKHGCIIRTYDENAIFVL